MAPSSTLHFPACSAPSPPPERSCSGSLRPTHSSSHLSYSPAVRSATASAAARSFLCGVVVFACASLGCGVARHIGELLFARCLQGIGGALLVPNSLALLSAEYEGPDRARAIGTWSGFSAIMTALGPVLGGWLVQHGSWRWAFFLNLPIAVATIWITLAKVPIRHSHAKQSPLDTTARFSSLQVSLPSPTACWNGRTATPSLACAESSA